MLRYESDSGERGELDGWGECTALPAPTYSSEYTAGAVEVSETYLVPALLSAKVATAGGVAPALAAVKGHKMAKSAFEAALGQLAFPDEARRWTTDLAALASPPGGRVTGLVYARIAAILGMGEREVRQLVFKRRR